MWLLCLKDILNFRKCYVPIPDGTIHVWFLIPSSLISVKGGCRRRTVGHSILPMMIMLDFENSSDSTSVLFYHLVRSLKDKCKWLLSYPLQTIYLKRIPHQESTKTFLIYTPWKWLLSMAVCYSLIHVAYIILILLIRIIILPTGKAIKMLYLKYNFLHIKNTIW